MELIKWFESTSLYKLYISNWPAPLNNAAFDLFLIGLILAIIFIPAIKELITGKIARKKMKKRTAELEEIQREKERLAKEAEEKKELEREEREEKRRIEAEEREAKRQREMMEFQAKLERERMDREDSRFDRQQAFEEEKARREQEIRELEARERQLRDEYMRFMMVAAMRGAQDAMQITFSQFALARLKDIENQKAIGVYKEPESTSSGEKQLRIESVKDALLSIAMKPETPSTGFVLVDTPEDKAFVDKPEEAVIAPVTEVIEPVIEEQPAVVEEAVEPVKPVKQESFEDLIAGMRGVNEAVRQKAEEEGVTPVQVSESDVSDFDRIMSLIRSSAETEEAETNDEINRLKTQEENKRKLENFTAPVVEKEHTVKKADTAMSALDKAKAQALKAKEEALKGKKGWFKRG